MRLRMAARFRELTIFGTLLLCVRCRYIVDVLLTLETLLTSFKIALHESMKLIHAAQFFLTRNRSPTRNAFDRLSQMMFWEIIARRRLSLGLAPSGHDPLQSEKRGTMRPSRPTKKRASDNPRIAKSTGEVFGDGSILELVSPETDRALRFLLWENGKQTIASRIEHGGRAYELPDMNETIVEAIRFPSDANEYGSAGNLFAEICEVFARYLGIASEEAALLTAWSTSTWFLDCFSSPPTLVISGVDTCHAVTLLRMLGCFCRRSLLLAEIDRSGLLDVAFLQPTLLLNQPGQLPRIWPLFDSSNYHGLCVIGKGRAHRVAGCKAVFAGMMNIKAEGAVRFSLAPGHGGLPTLDAERQAEIAGRFQPHLLMYRLRNLLMVRESCSSVLPRYLVNATARSLIASFRDEPNIAQAITPILRRQEEEERVTAGCDVVRAIIEAIWPSLHNNEEPLIGRIADLVNALLRTRGETLVYSPEEIGSKLRSLGFDRHRSDRGKVLRPCRQNSVTCHQLARRFLLDSPPVAGCADCQPPIVPG